MSRSNPTDMIPNPAVRWFEWNGDLGKVKYYDREKKVNILVDLPFEFVLLDRLSVIKGWHNASESSITSNEIRDTRKETMLVRAFGQAEPIAEGFYKDIKDTIKANGGRFAINLYIGFAGENGDLVLGSFMLNGAARNAWIDFEGDKEIRPHLYKKGIQIRETAHGEKGSGRAKIQWEAPVFELADLPQETNDEATTLDMDLLQPYLRNYFKRTRIEQAEPVKSEEDRVNDELNQGRSNEEDTSQIRDHEDDEGIPF